MQLGVGQPGGEGQQQGQRQQRCYYAEGMGLPDCEERHARRVGADGFRKERRVRVCGVGPRGMVTVSAQEGQQTCAYAFSRTRANKLIAESSQLYKNGRAPDCC